MTHYFRTGWSRTDTIKNMYREGKTVSQIISKFRAEGITLSGPQVRYTLGDSLEETYYTPVTAPVSPRPRKPTLVKPSKVVETPTKDLKLPKDTYEESESDNPEKIEINELLARLVKSNGLIGKQMIVLESPSLLTVKHLKKVGVTPYQIAIPNHTDSFNKIATRHPSTFLKTLGKYLEVTNEQHGFIFADYCGTLDGSTMFSPLDDIKSIFRNDLIANRGLLAVTISKRNGKKPNKYKNNDVSRLNQAVTQSAFDNGYTAVDLGHGRDYNKKMHFVVYQIWKH